MPLGLTLLRATRGVSCRRAAPLSATHRSFRRTMATLVTFDIDGTIVGACPKTKAEGRVTNSVHKDAITHGVKVVAGVDVLVNEVKYNGCTDREIARAMLELRGQRSDEEVLVAVMEAAAVYNADGDNWGTGLAVLPGVRELLDALTALGPEKVKVALVTGNIEEIAYRKMRAVGLDAHFTATGGFGGRFTSRADCLAHANRAAAEEVAITRSFHFGDAPADMAAAVVNNVTPVGVLTGIFDRDTLAKEAADAPIFDDLGDTKKVLATLGLAGV